MDIQDAYKFCPRCGNLGSKQQDRLHCTNCGHDYYYNPKPVTSVILKNEDDEYLFVRRAVEPKKGYLDFPGGFTEIGENFEQSARREVREELGVEVGELRYLSTHTDTYLYQGVLHYVTGVTYVGTIPKNTNFAPADDVESFEFISLTSLDKDRLAFPSMHEMVKLLSERNSV